MTKTRTLRESSKFLSKRYKFIRTLGTKPKIKNAFDERDERINRIRPVKDILIYEPIEIPEFDPTLDPSTVVIEDPRVPITQQDTNWPFRIEYIEQILDIDTLWVVVVDGRSPQGSYSSSSGAATPHTPVPGSGITLDLIKIEKPSVVVGDVRPIGQGRRALWCEKELRNLEEPGPRLIRSMETIWIQGKRPEQYVDIYLCNILPNNLTMYNCTFYERDVAHLYMESLSEYIKRFTDAQSPYNR